MSQTTHQSTWTAILTIAIAIALMVALAVLWTYPFNKTAPEPTVAAHECGKPDPLIDVVAKLLGAPRCSPTR